MKSLRKILCLSILFLQACIPAQESRFSTIYGEIEGQFALTTHPGVGVLWFSREGKLLFPFCSAIVLTESRVLTARHCFKAFRPGLDIYFDPHYLASPGDWDDQIDLNSSQIEFIGQLQKQPDPADMTLLRLESTLATENDSMILTSNEAALVPVVRALDQDLPLQALLYSYPGGKPLIVTGPCPVSVQAERIYHDCDSLPGSSGGLLVDAATGKAIGMHVQGAGSNSSAFFEENGRFETRAELLESYCKSRSPDASGDCIKANDRIFHNSAIDIRQKKDPE
jgi:V8-like Glu-specific endopeptidase